MCLCCDAQDEKDSLKLGEHFYICNLGIRFAFRYLVFVFFGKIYLNSLIYLFNFFFNKKRLNKFVESSPPSSRELMFCPQ
jgi:hypothetical protein